MELNEWENNTFDEWEIEAYETSDIILSQSSPLPNSLNNANQPYQPTPQAFPEVEIGSSSDEDAPPIPESTQLARENLELRNRVEQLVKESKTAEHTNQTLKSQLFKCRNIFKHQFKHLKNVFK